MLEIEPTDDINILYGVFYEKYKGLLFSTTEDEKRLRQVMCEKAKKAVDRYFEESNL